LGHSRVAQRTSPIFAIVLLRIKAAFCRVVPVGGEVIKSQPIVAARFAHPGLIPKPVSVSDTVWKWMAGS